MLAPAGAGVRASLRRGRPRGPLAYRLSPQDAGAAGRPPRSATATPSACTNQGLVLSSGPDPPQDGYARPGRSRGPGLPQARTPSGAPRIPPLPPGRWRPRAPASERTSHLGPSSRACTNDGVAPRYLPTSTTGSRAGSRLSGMYSGRKCEAHFRPTCRIAEGRGDSVTPPNAHQLRVDFHVRQQKSYG